MKRIIIVTTHKRIRIYLSILAFLFIVFPIGISKLTNQRVDVFNIIDTSKNEISLLEAYNEKDGEKANLYFENWNKESLHITKTKYSDSVEESLYGIYKAVFHPYNLGPLLNPQIIDSIEYDLIDVIHKAPYAVTQDKIDYIIYDFKKIDAPDFLDYFMSENINQNEIETLVDFYPQVDLDENKVLHLTKEYEKELTEFLGTKEHPLGEGSIMSPAGPKEETLKRYEFLRTYIPVLYGHWGGYWHLSTHPEILFVSLSQELDHAITEYRIGYTFGYMEVKKVNGDWTMVRAIMNSME